MNDVPLREVWVESIFADEHVDMYPRGGSPTIIEERALIGLPPGGRLFVEALVRLSAWKTRAGKVFCEKMRVNKTLKFPSDVYMATLKCDFVAPQRFI